MRTNMNTNPFQEMIRLNSNALQSFSYLMPRELAQVNNPLELFEKQVELCVKNSYYMMDYLHQLSNIFNQSCDLYADKITETTKAALPKKRKAKRANPLNIKAQSASAKRYH